MALVPGATILTLPGNVHAAWSDASRGDLRPTGHGPNDGIPLAELAGDAHKLLDPESGDDNDHDH